MDHIGIDVHHPPPHAGFPLEPQAPLAEHPVSGYVILDNHRDMGELRAHLVQTRPAHGLQWDDAPPAIARLARPLTSLAPR